MIRTVMHSHWYEHSNNSLTLILFSCQLYEPSFACHVSRVREDFGRIMGKIYIKSWHMLGIDLGQWYRETNTVSQSSQFCVFEVTFLASDCSWCCIFS